MKTVPSPLQTYLDANETYFDRNYFWITLVSGATYGFCDGDDDETVTVVNPATGGNVSRAYKGGGHVEDVPDLVDSPEMNVRSVAIPLSMSSTDVATMIRTQDLRGAAIEWHKGFVSEDTNAFISTPACEFLGFVNGVQISDGSVDLAGDGTSSEVIVLDCNSHAVSLMRTNVRTRSYQAGLERSGDEIFKYANSAHRWKIRWGKESHSHDEGRGEGRGKGKGGIDPLNGFGHDR